MNVIRKLRNLFRRTPAAPEPRFPRLSAEGQSASGPVPTIETKWGIVPEGARLQAETNLRLDPIKRARVLDILTREAGGDREAAINEFRRRYPYGGM